MQAEAGSRRPAEQLMYRNLALTNTCHQLTFYCLAVKYTTRSKAWFIYETVFSSLAHSTVIGGGGAMVVCSQRSYKFWRCEVVLLVEVGVTSRMREWYQEHRAPTEFLRVVCVFWLHHIFIFLCVCVCVWMFSFSWSLCHLFFSDHLNMCYPLIFFFLLHSQYQCEFGCTFSFVISFITSKLNG